MGKHFKLQWAAWVVSYSLHQTWLKNFHIEKRAVCDGSDRLDQNIDYWICDNRLAQLFCRFLMQNNLGEETTVENNYLSPVTSWHDWMPAELV